MLLQYWEYLAHGFILVIVRVIKLLNLSRAMYLIKNCPQQLKWPVIAILFMAIAVFA